MPNPKLLLQKRAELFKQLRSFFYQRDVLEVEAPLLSEAAVTDLHIESIPALIEQQGKTQEYFLITSPEFFMKRLLAHGSGSIFYLGKVFRQNEHGRKHHHEFTMLEWYRIGWDEHQLMDEVVELLKQCLPNHPVKKISYGALFESIFAVNPYMATDNQLRQLLLQHIEIESSDLLTNDYLDLLFTHCIEPRLNGITMVYDYPESQAALARKSTNDKGEQIARRFEVFIDDMELANGYYELINAREQRQRFMADLSARKMYGKKLLPQDEKLLAALEQGLPDCAGVALGVDRLLMKMMGVQSLAQVFPFT